jgi:hypothetical protein
MKEQLVTFETAKLAKEKGFNWLCYNAYNLRGMLYSNGWCEYIDDNETELPFDSTALREKDMLAPTQSLLQKWFREEHSIFVFVEPTLGEDFGMFAVYATDKEQNDLGLNLGYESSYQAKTYEEALEKGLQETLKLI